jgi:hypothetical protein
MDRKMDVERGNFAGHKTGHENVRLLEGMGRFDTDDTLHLNVQFLLYCIS